MATEPSPGEPAADEPALPRPQEAPRRAGEAVVLGTAVMFLTRLPVGRFCSPDPEVLSRSTRWFPLVGLLVGTLLSLVWLGVSVLAPSSIACAAVLVAGVLLTGAFHEDGLADVADSAGAFGIDRKLEIMRDSRVGTYGALALVLLVLSRFVLLWELSVMAGETVVAALIAAHVLARWSSVWLMARVPYARPEAANRVVAEGVGGRRLLEATAVALLALAPSLWLNGVGGWACLPALLASAFAIAFAAGRFFRRRFGGITGDCLGAGNVLVEIGVLLAALLLAAP